MEKLQKLPLTQSSFPSIIEENLLYVDKTRQILTLLDQGKYVFLSRPRRFGKSLLVSTLKSLFEGKKKLFKGLYIEEKWDWKEYPVIWMDFSALDYLDSTDTLKNDLVSFLKGIAQDYKVKVSGKTYKTFLRNLIKQLSRKFDRGVVFLIDEYDKPITDFINDPARVEENRRLLKDFYTTLKSQNDYIHKVFITGVSKFAKISVFSGMNNASDLTLVPELNDIVGLTRKDIVNYFDAYLEKIDTKFGFNREQSLATIKHWYDGYSWDGVNTIYNPFSIVHFFNHLEFQNFWYQSGTPTLLINLIMQKAYQGESPKKPTEYEDIEVTQTTFESAEVTNLNVEGLLFQTGYLTIVNKDESLLTPIYTLNYPNHEVRWSFMAHILETYAQMPKREVEPGALMLKRALQQGNQALFLKLLKSYFALIPYQLRHSANEAYYHSLFQMVFTLIGIRMISERSTDEGRIDGVIEFEDKVYILEFKHKRTGTVETLAKTALRQIETNNYAQAFEANNKVIQLVGVGFLEKNKNGEGKTLLEIGAKWKVL